MSRLKDKQALFEQRRRESLVEQARQQSDVLRKIEAEKAQERAENLLLFFLYGMMDDELRRLESQRDAHTPKSPDDPWDEAFCDAVRKIPKVRAMCNELCIAWYNAGRPKYASWI